MLNIWITSTSKSLTQVIDPIVKQSGVPYTYLMYKEDVLPTIKPGEVLLSCGDKPLKMLQATGVLAKGRTIGSMRGREIPYQEGSLFVTYDPGIVNRDYSQKNNIQWDVTLAIRLLMTGSTVPPLGKYRYVEDFSDVIEYVHKTHEATSRKVAISCDLETLGLDEWNHEAFIVSIAFTCKAGMADIIRFVGPCDPKYPVQGEKLWNQISWLLTSDKTVTRGANFKFDTKWMWRKWAINCTNFTFDTTLVGSLLDENRSNSLNSHAKIYSTIGGYDDPFNATFDKSRMDLVPDEDLLTYACGDTDSCLQVSERMLAELRQDPQLFDFYVKLLHPSSIAFEMMEREGVLLDQEFYLHPVAEYEDVVDDKGKSKKVLVRGLRQSLVETLETVQRKALGQISNHILNKYRAKGEDVSLTRSVILKEYMFTHVRGLKLKPKMVTEKTQAPSTAMQHLLMFEDSPEAKSFVAMLKEFTSAKKTLSTYVDGFLNHLRSDGRFHATYMLFKGEYNGEDDSGTNTGRTSAKDPAVQTIPKHSVWAKYLRRGYIAPPGYVVVNWDYAQGELKIAACIAKEPTMIKAYQEGFDLHMITGGTIMGYTTEDMLDMKEKAKTNTKLDDLFKKIRQGGKAGNFGLLYGMGVNGFIEYARVTYGVVLSQKEGQTARDNFFGLYGTLIKWHDWSKDQAKKFGKVRSPLGRLRHLPLVYSPDNEFRAKAERQAINSQVQSTLSDLSQLSLALFWKEYGTPDGCRFFMMCHDALTAYVLESELGYWIPRVTNLMSNLPLLELFGWNHQLQFTVDCEVGTNMSNLEAINLEEYSL